MTVKNGICLLNDSFPPMIDGVANAVVNYARRLTERGDPVTVATPAVPGADDSAFPFPVLRYPSFDTRKKFGYVSGRPFSPELAARLQKEGVGILHTHCPIVSTFLARELRDVVDAPIVLTYHTKFDIDIAKAIRGKLLQESAIHALVQNISACDEVWTVSRGAGENLRSLGYQGEYLVMPNGVDLPRGRLTPEEIQAVTGGFDLPEAVPCFLFVGRLMWYKGIRIILDALAALRDRGISFRMVFLGGGMDEADIRNYTGELGLTDRCLFPGSVRDRQALRAWYCRADLFLFPSSFDTNGLVVREAAACGLPAVLIRGSCAAEDVTDGVTGFLIEENAPSMAECLTELLRSPSRVSSVGKAAEERLYLSWADAVDHAVARYEVVMERYRSGQRRKPRLTDEMFRSVGELMALSGQISSFGEELAREIHCSGSEMAQRMRSGYDEAKEKLLTGSEEFARKVRENQAEAKEKLLTGYGELARKVRKNQAESRELWDAICQMLDRYL